MDILTQGIGYTRLLESEPLASKKGYWILFNNTVEEAKFAVRKGDATAIEKVEKEDRDYFLTNAEIN